MLREKGGGSVEEGSSFTCGEVNGVRCILLIAFLLHTLTCNTDLGYRVT